MPRTQTGTRPPRMATVGRPTVTGPAGFKLNENGTMTVLSSLGFISYDNLKLVTFFSTCHGVPISHWQYDFIKIFMLILENRSWPVAAVGNRRRVTTVE